MREEPTEKQLDYIKKLQDQAVKNGRTVSTRVPATKEQASALIEELKREKYKEKNDLGIDPEEGEHEVITKAREVWAKMTPKEREIAHSITRYALKHHKVSERQQAFIDKAYQEHTQGPVVQ